MFDYLDNLRAKPDNVKTRIAISVSLIITLMIASVWFVSKYIVPKSDTNTEIVAVDTQGPISSMSATVSTAFKNLSQEFGNLKDRLSEFFSESYASPTSVSDQNIEY